MLRTSAQRLKRVNFRLSSFQSIQAPLGASLDFKSNNEANNRPIPAWSFQPICLVSHRCFSTTQCDNQATSTIPTPLSGTAVPNGELITNTSTTFEDTMEKIFDATQQQMIDAETAVAATAAAKEAGLLWEPSMWKPTDIAVETIRFVHETIGLDYGWSIIATTILLRIIMLPVVAMVQANQSRMAHMMPEMNILNERYKNLRSPTMEEQIRHSKELSALFRKYEANPFRSFWLPVIQLPAFLGLFFGLQKMAKYPVFHDDLAVGGMLWFPDLTIPDPLYILPLTSALSFLAIIEITRQTTSQGSMSKSMQSAMTNGMRALALVMIPISISFPSAVVAYWTTNNMFTFGQLAVFTLKPVKKALNIWDPPKPVPGAANENLFETLKNTVQPKPTTEDLIKKHNDKVESQQKMKELSKQALTLRKAGRKVGSKLRK